MQYYNNMPDFATSPGTGHISDWGNREERKKQTIEDSCRNLDIVSDACTCVYSVHTCTCICIAGIFQCTKNYVY